MRGEHGSSGMVEPMRRQVFFASHAPVSLWHVLVLAAFECWGLYTAEAGWEMMTHWRSALGIIAVMLVSIPLGLFAASLSAWPIFGSLYLAQDEANGGPFEVGDTVQVIAGHYRGCIGRARCGSSNPCVSILAKRPRTSLKISLGGANFCGRGERTARHRTTRACLQAGPALGGRTLLVVVQRLPLDPRALRQEGRQLPRPHPPRFRPPLVPKNQTPMITSHVLG